MKIRFTKLMDNDGDVTGMSIYIDEEFFGGFDNSYTMDAPEDVNLYRDLRFLLELPDLMTRMQKEGFTISVGSEYEESVND